MKRRGRRHLPKVHEPIAPSGFEHSAFTVEGTIERAGAFTRGVSAHPQTKQRRIARVVVAGFVVLFVVALLIPLLSRVL
jgi:hypothetical protein